MANHGTRECRYKKPTGCWRCGGPHLIPQCTAPYQGNRRSQEGKKGGEEQDRQKYLSLVNHVERRRQTEAPYASLTYLVQIKNTPITVLATVDTGAQCSAIRADVYQALTPPPPLSEKTEEEKPDMRGVSGEPLNVLGKCNVCIHARGITMIEELWVVDGIHPQLILGLPWVIKEKPQVEWGTGTLVFEKGIK